MSESSLHAAWHVAETASYVIDNGHAIVCLQFPDELLQHATQVAVLLQQECTSRGHSAQLYVLADTTYNSLSVDEVAAQHVGAQCVVHYGRASMTKLSRLPAFFVFPEAQLNVEAAASCLAASTAVASSQHVLVFVDQPLLHLLPQLRERLAALLGEQGAGARMAFATVPTRQLKPQQRPAEGAAVAATSMTGGSSSSSSGCCRAAEGGQQPAGAAREPAAGACCEPAAAGRCQAAHRSCCAGSRGPCQAEAAAGTAPAEASASEPSPGTDATAAGDGSDANSLAGYAWELPSGVSTANCCLVWVGAEEAPALLQLQMTFNGCQWAVHDPRRGGVQEGLPLQISRALRRRYFLVEKARVANIVGILVGTLGVAGYRDAIQRLRSAAQRAGKKTYTLLMGKPSPAKLANFPEVEVFVMISDPQGQILDSKEYLAPIITPYEAMLAFSLDAEWDERRYRLDFDGVPEAAEGGAGAAGSSAGHFSLLDGAFHAAAEPGTGDANAAAAAEYGGSALALRAHEALQITAAPGGRSDLLVAKSAADYFLHKRTYAGLEAPLVGAEEKAVEKAAAGRSGRAAGYSDERGQG